MRHVAMLFRSLILKSAGLKPVETFVRRSRLFRPIVSRFIAGDSLDEAMGVALKLSGAGFGVSLDLLGENVATLEEAEAAASAYVEVVERIAAEGLAGKVGISIKLTALGLDQGEGVAEGNYRRLLDAAGSHGIFVRADMEGSEYTERTVAMVRRVHRDYPLTGTVLQSYLRRTDKDLEELIGEGMSLRLVKGAYLEPSSVAYPEKGLVDGKFLEQSKKLLLRGRYPGIATHDAGIIDYLKRFVSARGLRKDGFEWQMLYGIRRDLQHELLEEGFPVRVYVPYGEAWYPYFSRRLAERPANLQFIVGSLLKK